MHISCQNGFLCRVRVFFHVHAPYYKFDDDKKLQRSNNEHIAMNTLQWSLEITVTPSESSIQGRYGGVSNSDLVKTTSFIIST